MKNNNGLVEWISIIVLGASCFFVAQHFTEQEREEEQREAQIQAAQEQDRQERAEVVRENIQKLSKEMNSNGCSVEYSDWSVCTPDGEQTRLVTSFTPGCSMGETTRSCAYTNSPLFSYDMDQINGLVISDIEGKGGSFQYTAYDKGTAGKYVNSISIAVVPSTNTLSVTRQTLITETGELFSNTTLYDSGGGYAPDMVSVFGQPAVPLSQIDVATSAQYLTIWEQVMVQYMMIYAN